jgi:hypothetical protein
MLRALVFLASVVAAAPAFAAPQDDFAAIEKQFVEMPMEARRLTGPLFWLHGTESRERLQMYIEKVAESHNGTFTAESRPHNDWLGPRWYEDLAICLEAAKKHNLTMWIFDEKWWPSGEVGGKVPPEYGAKTMLAEAASVEGPRPFTAEGYGGPQFIAAVAGKEVEGGAVDGDSLVDLAPNIKGGTLTWSAPPGRWKVMKFAWKFTGGRRILVDGASSNCVDWYIKTVYQPHYDRFKDDFGKTIKGYFYDEPETPGDWGTEVLPMLAARKIDWKKPLVAWKFQLAGDEQAAAKYQYQDAFAEAWGKTLYGGLSDWCRDHKVISMGHFLEHNWEYLQPRLCAGNMFQLQKYSDMGGIDLVCRQFYPGQKKMQFWQMAKLGSSIAHMYAKTDDIAMCEMFGAYGQDITYPQMKWLTDQMQVRGVNKMIPHSFNPKSPYDTDCPPYFYNGGCEPRYPLYRVYADYTNRLSLMLTGGRHVAPVAFLFLGNSKHVGKAIPPEEMTTALDDALYDSDWMPYDVFENDAKLAGKEIRLHQESYRVLIVPPVEVIPYAALAKAREFFDAGGIVLGYGFLPTKSATLGKTARDIAALTEAVWGAGEPGLAVRKTSPAGGRSYLLPEKPSPQDLAKVLTADAGVHPAMEVLEGETGGWLHVLHRVKAGRDVFLICNQNHQGDARHFKFRAAAAGVPEWWDAMRNEVSALPYKRIGPEAVEFEMTLEPSESALVVFAPEGKARKPRIEALKPLRPAIEVVREPIIGPQWPSRPPEPDSKAPGAEKASGDLSVKAPGPAASLANCPWVWFPGENARTAATPGARCFRREVTLDQRKIKDAKFVVSCDNEFTLFVNGKEAGKDDGGGDSWARPQTINVAKHLKAGANALAIAAVNGSNEPNPAGLIGRLTVTFDSGDPLVVTIDKSWRAAKQGQAGWKDAGFDDKSWPAAEAVATFGDAPWGRIAGGGSGGGGGRRGGLTVSPITADLFRGKCEIPADVDLAKVRAILVAEGLPDDCAAVTVNGAPVGGFLGAPCRLDVTAHLKRGQNVIEIAPLAPKAARIVIYPASD